MRRMGRWRCRRSRSTVTARRRWGCRRAMEHRPYRKDEAEREPRRCEWVSLTHGDVCVRAMTVSELLQIQDRAQRPKIDPRGGIDPGWSALLQVALSCYDGEGEDAEPIWPASLDMRSMDPINRLPVADFQKI